MRKSKGFSLVELVAILLIVGVLAATAITKIQSADTLQLQASRDSIVAALHSAQQLSMSRQATVQLIPSTTQVDIQVDGTSVSVGGVQYPISVIANQSLSFTILNPPSPPAVTPTSLVYNRLGHTNAALLQLSQNGKVINITVNESGHVQ